MSFQKDTTAQVKAAESAAAEGSSGGTSIGRIGILIAVGIVLAVAAFALTRFRRPSIAFPETVDFGEQHLTKATDWLREGVSGVVYVR